MNILISNNGKEALFHQIKEQIKKNILFGELKEGDALPSMRMLAKQLQVSVITTKRAYEDLEKEGLLYTIVGKGTFIAKQLDEGKECKIAELQTELHEVVCKAKRLGWTISDLKERIETLFDEEL